jgi:hypothetical protein
MQAIAGGTSANCWKSCAVSARGANTSDMRVFECAESFGMGTLSGSANHPALLLITYFINSKVKVANPLQGTKETNAN